MTKIAHLPSASRLTNRSVIEVGGEERRAFLQGLISNDMNDCMPGQAIYAALLTPQGKFLHDLFIIDSEKYFLIDCESARVEDLIKRLLRYKLRSKITIENKTVIYDCWALWKDADLSAFVEKTNTPNSLFYVDPRLPELGLRAIINKFDKLDGVKICDFEAYDKHRLALGAPDGSRDMIIEKSTLLECNFDFLHGISWTKGCYTGQELTARTHYRGLIKKRLYPVSIKGAVPAPGSTIYRDTAEVGEMRSSSANSGLALLSIEMAERAINEAIDFTCDNSQITALRTISRKLRPN